MKTFLRFDYCLLIQLNIVLDVRRDVKLLGFEFNQWEQHWFGMKSLLCGIIDGKFSKPIEFNEELNLMEGLELESRDKSKDSHWFLINSSIITCRKLPIQTRVERIVSMGNVPITHLRAAKYRIVRVGVCEKF